MVPERERRPYGGDVPISNSEFSKTPSKRSPTDREDLANIDAITLTQEAKIEGVSTGKDKQTWQMESSEIDSPHDAYNSLDVEPVFKEPALESIESSKNSGERKRKSNGEIAGGEEEDESEPQGERRRKRQKKGGGETYAVRKAKKASPFFNRRREQRLAGIKPVSEGLPKNLVAIAIRKNEDRKDYKQVLENLSTEKPTVEQMGRLEKAKALGPNYLGRTVSLTSG